jgi:hypothetical protein
VEKRSTAIQWQGHKVEPQPVPKGKMGGATVNFTQVFTSTFTFTLHKLHNFTQQHFGTDCENDVEFEHRHVCITQLLGKVMTQYDVLCHGTI